MTRAIRHAVSAVALALIVSPLALAQTPAQSPGRYLAPRLSWGAPDLQGVWTNSSITRLSRPAGVDHLVLTPAEAKKLEDADYNNIRTAAEKAPTSPTEGAPEKGKPLPPVGNYNAVWVDPGSKVAIVNGELRSSWIVEPKDGRVPVSDQGRKRMAGSRIAPAGAASAAERSYLGPESRSTGERCLIGFGGTGGPVMLNVLYNNHYQIVQAPNYVVIDIEMDHDARIIPIVKDAVAAGARHGPKVVPKWLGDSVGWYEGSTLVVETKNVNPQQTSPVFMSEAGTLTERFTRLADDQILYEFAVADPAIYSQTWKGEMPFVRTKDNVYEYACHEGNYAMKDILAGARMQERDGRALALTAESE